MSELFTAYASYLEDMYEQSHELVTVDVFTVPADVNPDSPAVQEWADFA